MTTDQFIATWQASSLKEQQGAQTWFEDLCGVLEVPPPDGTGELGGLEYLYEKRTAINQSADAYYQDHFVWEFKYQQQDIDSGMRDAHQKSSYLMTPPLLVASSFQEIRIETNFPGIETIKHEVSIQELRDPDQRDLLRRVFTEPQWFNSCRTRDQVTKETAELFESITRDMASSAYDQRDLARYLNQIIFCLYAEDAGLLPKNSFKGTVTTLYRNPDAFRDAAQDLFSKMNDGNRTFGPYPIDHFNGELFAQVPDITLSAAALERLAEACRKDWGNIEPSIFGTLFERALGLVEERDAVGAHYTSEQDIRRIVDPVIRQPLQRMWETSRPRSPMRKGVGNWTKQCRYCSSTGNIWPA